MTMSKAIIKNCKKDFTIESKRPMWYGLCKLNINIFSSSI